MAENKGVMLYFNYRKPLDNLSLEERGKFLTAILDYAAEGIFPDFTGAMKMLFDCMQPRIDEDIKSYLHKCEVNSKNAKKRTLINPSQAFACDGNQPQLNNTKQNKTKKDEIKEIDKLGVTVL